MRKKQDLIEEAKKDLEERIKGDLDGFLQAINEASRYIVHRLILDEEVEKYDALSYDDISMLLVWAYEKALDFIKEVL